MSRRLALTFAVLTALAISGCGDDSATTCTAGTDGCECGPEVQCFAGLQCVAGRCQGGPDTPGGTGSNPGASTGVSTGTTANTAPTTGLDAGDATGGTTSTGPTTDAMVADTEPACTNTQNDPLNCGECGHVCRKGTTDSCKAGVCDPHWVECADSDSFAQVPDTCAEYCALKGELCAGAECGVRGDTSLLVYIDVDEPWVCASHDEELAARTDVPGCDEPMGILPLREFTCCCTDTPE